MRHRENNQNLLTFSGHLEVLRKLLFRILGVTVCIAVFKEFIHKTIRPYILS